MNPPPDAAFAPPPTNDVLIAEMNRQREATARVMLEAAKLAQSYGELQAVLGEMKNVARNNALLNVRLATNEQRVVEFSKELQKLSAVAVARDERRARVHAGNSPRPRNHENTLLERGSYIASLRRTRQMPCKPKPKHESL